MRKIRQINLGCSQSCSNYKGRFPRQYMRLKQPTRLTGNYRTVREDGIFRSKNMSEAPLRLVAGKLVYCVK